jgi:hypothetical protein
MVCLHKMENDRPLSSLEIGLKTEHKVFRNTIIDHQKLCETMLDWKIVLLGQPSHVLAKHRMFNYLIIY